MKIKYDFFECVYVFQYHLFVFRENKTLLFNKNI